MKYFIYAILLSAASVYAADYIFRDATHQDHRDSVKMQIHPSFENDVGLEGESLAWAVLETNAKQYDLPPDLSNLELNSVRQSLLGTHYRFGQVLNGHQVHTAEIIVSISRETGKILRVYNNTYPIQAGLVRSPDVRLNENDALEVAWNHLRVHGELLTWPQTELVYTPEGNDFRLNYLVTLGVEKPFGYYLQRIDATTGAVIEVKDAAISEKTNPNMVNYKIYSGPIRDRQEALNAFRVRMEIRRTASKAATRANGTGVVFDPDPRTTLNDETLRDTSPASAFVDAYYTRPLLDIEDDAGTYRLNGPWVQLIDFESPNVAPSTTVDGNWTAERGDDSFDDAMVYFHIDQNQRYMQSLGFSGGTGIQELSIECDSNGLGGDDNSHYIPSTNRLAWGHGCVNDSEDLDVILHEYGHAINHDINPNFSGGDTGGIGEGFGDYWAGSYSYVQHNGDVFHPEWIFSWDGHHDCWDGRNMDVTDAQYDPTQTYGAHQTVNGVLADELWSTPNFQALLTLINDHSVPRGEVDQCILEAQFGLGSGITMRDMGNAIIQAAGTLYPAGPHAQVFTDKFSAQNIVEIPHATLVRQDVVLQNAGANGVADPGETLDLIIAVHNTGTLNATSVSGHLVTSTPGVGIVEADSAYPDIIMGGAQNNLSPFTISVDPGVNCGDRLDFELQVTYTDDSVKNINLAFDLQTGIPLGADASVSPGLAILDQQTVDSPLVVSGTGAMVTANLNIDIDITHTFIGDLIVTLISPTATSVILHNRTGSSANDIVGNYPNTLSPAESLTAFIGEPLDGTWILRVSDNANQDEGTLNSWALHDVSGYECEQGDCGQSTLEAEAGNDMHACSGSPASLNGDASGGVGVYSYTWSPAGVLDNPNIASPIATITETTTFDLLVSDDFCSKVDSVTIHVIGNLDTMVASWRTPYDPAFDINGDLSLDILDQVALVDNCQ